jgi:predicted PurR-regulated permease PerM
MFNLKSLIITGCIIVLIVNGLNIITKSIDNKIKRIEELDKYIQNKIKRLDELNNDINDIMIIKENDYYKNV